MKVFVDSNWVTLSDQEIEYGAYAKLTMMDEKIKRVRELHENHDGKCLECSVFVDDGVNYPCGTIQALDGDV